MALIQHVYLWKERYKMPLQELQRKLENNLKKSVKLVINDNHSTMLSVKWEPKCTKISMHRFFLDAPDQVMNDLVHYVKTKRKGMSPVMKSFIEENLHTLDYRHRLKDKMLDVQGLHYNLKDLMDQVNAEYFRKKLDLQITWFGNRVQKNRSKITFGLYQEPFKLVKINRILDSIKTPNFLISYIIYHEMLHHVCPSYCDESGKRRIHNNEFKKMEKQFRDYEKATAWINDNRERLFR